MFTASPTPVTADAPDGAADHRMTCMEIVGGHHPIQQRFSTTGLDVWAFSEPHAGDDAGGDIHYISMCGAGAITRFLLADVAGHGRTAGQVAADLRDLMRRHINQLDTTRLAGAINDAFSRDTADGLFATALLSTWFAPSEQLILVNAGHPRPLWHKAEAGTWEPLSADHEDCDQQAPRNLPLGILPDVGYPQFAVTLERGDMVVLYTDSLIEARPPGGGPWLGEAGLIRRAEALTRQADHTRDASEIGKQLLRAVADYRCGAPADDDQTLLVLQHNDNPPPEMSLRDHLNVMAKMLGLKRA